MFLYTFFLLVVMETHCERRTAIKFYLKNELMAIETHKLLQKVYSNECLSSTNVFEWHGKFRNSRESVDNDPRVGHPRTSRTPKQNAKVHTALADDWYSMIRMLAEQLYIAKDTVRKIITDLGEKKLCAWYVPHALTSEQWEDRITSCCDYIQMHENDRNFLIKLSWYFIYLESKHQSATWVGPRLPKAKKLRFKKQRIRSTLVAFFNSRGLIHEEFVLTGQTDNANFYKDVLDCLIERINRIRSDLHASWRFVSSAWQRIDPQCGIGSPVFGRKNVTVLHHPTRLLDLAPADYFLFPKLKLQLKKGVFWRYSNHPETRDRHSEGHSRNWV